MFKYVITAVLFCQYILQCFLTQTRTVHLYSVQCTSKVYFNNGLNWWSWSSSTENSIFQVLSSYKNLSCPCTVIHTYCSCPCPVTCISLVPVQLSVCLLSLPSYTHLSYPSPVIRISLVTVQLYTSLLSLSSYTYLSCPSILCISCLYPFPFNDPVHVHLHVSLLSKCTAVAYIFLVSVHLRTHISLVPVQ